MDIAYDGTDFSGWAAQPGRRTVCGVLVDALSTVLREPVALTVAGRTDAGVHATGQVAHADLAADLDTSELVRRLARLLPPDVRVRTVGPVMDNMRLQLVGVLGYAGVLPVVAFLLARLFAADHVSELGRALQRSSTGQTATGNSDDQD